MRTRAFLPNFSCTLIQAERERARGGERQLMDSTYFHGFCWKQIQLRIWISSGSSLMHNKMSLSRTLFSQTTSGSD